MDQYFGYNTSDGRVKNVRPSSPSMYQSSPGKSSTAPPVAKTLHHGCQGKSLAQVEYATRVATYLLVRQIEERGVCFESLDRLEGAVAVEENSDRFFARDNVRDDLPTLELGRYVFDEELGNRRRLGRGCVSGLRRRTAVLTCRGRDGRRGQLADGESGSEPRMVMPAG